MNGNSDKHKPLSPEELFRLLETKNEGTLPYDELDDFEREALEGFSAHGSAEKAREMTEEVHQRIHEQLDERRKKRPVARIVWFGAAASVVMGLIISAYIITQQAKVSNELALNKNEVADEVNSLPAPPLLEESPAKAMDEAHRQENESKPQVPSKESIASPVESKSAQNGISAEVYTASTDGDFKQSKNDVAADEVSVEKSKDGVKKGQGQAGMEYDLKLAETQKQEERKEGYVSNGTVAANKAPAVPVEALTTMAPGAEKTQKASPVSSDDVIRSSSVTKAKFSVKKAKEAEEKASQYEYDIATATGSAKTEDHKGPLGNARAAYYKGGDQELKAQVLAWFKEHQYEAPKGSYAIRMKIGADGATQVLEVKAEKNADEKPLKHLEESLQSLKDWNPAIRDQEAAGSETSFLLSF